MLAQDKLFSNSNPVFCSTAWGECVKVTPGVIDENAIAYFTRGQCHSLALTLEDVFRWEVCVLLRDSEILHCFNRMPDGKLIDITGIFSSSEVIERFKSTDEDSSEFSTCSIYELSEVVEFTREEGWIKPDWNMAGKFVYTVEQEYLS